MSYYIANITDKSKINQMLGARWEITRNRLNIKRKQKLK